MSRNSDKKFINGVAVAGLLFCILNLYLGIVNFSSVDAEVGTCLSSFAPLEGDQARTHFQETVTFTNNNADGEPASHEEKHERPFNNTIIRKLYDLQDDVAAVTEITAAISAEYNEVFAQFTKENATEPKPKCFCLTNPSVIDEYNGERISYQPRRFTVTADDFTTKSIINKLLWLAFLGGAAVFAVYVLLDNRPKGKGGRGRNPTATSGDDGDDWLVGTNAAAGAQKRRSTGKRR